MKCHLCPQPFYNCIISSGDSAWSIFINNCLLRVCFAREAQFTNIRFKIILKMEIEPQQDYSKELQELDDKIKDAEENFGDIEVRDAILAKANFIRKTVGDGE